MNQTILFYEYGKRRIVVPIIGLVSYYKLENNLIDSGLGGNNGVNINSATYGSGKLGNGLVTNGISSYVEMGNPSNLRLDIGTISCWVKTDVTANNTGHRGIFGKSGAYFLFLYDGALEIYNWGTSSRISTSINIVDGLWHHIALVFESGTGANYIYLDGVKVLTCNMTVGTQSDTVKIGWNWGPQYFKGTIDEAVIHNTKLTDSEIASLYNNDTGVTL